MPRKQKHKPQDKTLSTRFANNPYFYKKSNSQNENDIKYDTFIRGLRVEFRNLRKENLDLKNQLKLKTREAEKLGVLNNLQVDLQKKAIDLLNVEKNHLAEEISNLKAENEKLKAENVKLNGQIKIYVKAIDLYQNEMAKKILGNVTPGLDTYFLKFS